MKFYKSLGKGKSYAGAFRVYAVYLEKPVKYIAEISLAYAFSGVSHPEYQSVTVAFVGHSDSPVVRSIFERI